MRERENDCGLKGAIVQEKGVFYIIGITADRCCRANAADDIKGAAVLSFIERMSVMQTVTPRVKKKQG
jgi:hypothetical protein